MAVAEVPTQPVDPTQPADNPLAGAEGAGIPVPSIKGEKGKKARPKVDTTKVKKFVANFIVPIVALTLTAILFLVVLRPSFTELPLLEQELQSKQALAISLEQKFNKLNTLLDFKSNVEEDNVLVSKALESESKIPQLLTQIDLMARESGLDVRKLSYAIGDSTGTSAVNYKVVSVNLGTDGTYDQVVTFLRTLENAGRVVGVENIRFSQSSKDENIISTSFVLVSPYVELTTNAVTDDPIEFDITDQSFQDMIDRLKQLRIYDISIDEVIDIEDLPGADEEETTTEGVEEGAEAPLP